MLEIFLKMNNLLDEIYKNLDNIKKLNPKGELNFFIEEFESEIKLLKENILELKNPFVLFIIGGGNYGKSTLINTLLNKNIIDTSDIPNTWRINTFFKSKEEKMEIIYNDDKKISFSINEGKNILKEEEKKYLESKRYIKNLMKENKYDTSYKSILEEKFLYKSNISRINYFLDEKILDDFSIVDTPGLNQNLKLTTLNSMKDYYNMSDAILWLIDAQNIVAKKNNELINEIDEFAKIYGNNKNIIAVVNKIDTISLHGEKNLEKIKEKANQIYKDYFKDIVFISAKFKTNIDTLYESIDYNLKREILENKIKSKKASIYISKDKLLNLILKYKRNLYESISIYNESNYNKSISKTILDENFKMSHVSFENVDKLIFHLNNIQNIVCKRGWDFEQKY